MCYTMVQLPKNNIDGEEVIKEMIETKQKETNRNKLNHIDQKKTKSAEHMTKLRDFILPRIIETVSV